MSHLYSRSKGCICHMTSGFFSFLRLTFPMGRWQLFSSCAGLLSAQKLLFLMSCIVWGVIFHIIWWERKGKAISHCQHFFFYCLLVMYLFAVYFLHVCVWSCKIETFSAFKSWRQTITKFHSNTQLHIKTIWLNRRWKQTIRLKQVSYSIIKPQNNYHWLY